MSIDRERGAVLQSAVSQNCILRAADKSSAVECLGALPITNRLYGRVQLRATGLPADVFIRRCVHGNFNAQIVLSITEERCFGFIPTIMIPNERNK